ncbi:ABC transporter ATP-binding protein, partial [Pseudomonas sp. BGM005]|nr:ABC transporter ATP-binding protein [Pseudomonas sp. BG5]
NDIVARYQRRLYAHLMTLSVGFFSEARSAHIAAQVSQNVSGIRDVLNLTITSTVRDLLTFVSLIGVMVLQDPLLSLAVFIMAPPLLYALRYVSKR